MKSYMTLYDIILESYDFIWLVVGLPGRQSLQFLNEIDKVFITKPTPFLSQGEGGHAQIMS